MKPKVAIVHDWMVSPGGGEKVVLALHKLWPEAPIYTAAYEPARFPEFAQADIRTLWLDRIQLAKRKHQLFSIPRAWAFRSLDLSDYDIVISSSSAESKYVKTGPKTLHICYCHTPIRYYWSDYDWYRQHPPFGWLNPLARVVLPLLIPLLRMQDFRAAQKVDVFVANSKHVQQRIRRYYDRDSAVIYPPVEVKRIRMGVGPGKYYLVLGRQVAYKRLDLAVEAFNRLGLPLVVAGTGEEIEVQRPKAQSNIKFVGRPTDEQKAKLYQTAKALVFAAEEDFGIVPVEAQAAGRPVIAYGVGGATESVVDGVTGVLFKPQTAEALGKAVERSSQTVWNPTAIRRQAEKFDESVFSQRIRQFVLDEWRKFQAKGPSSR